MTNDPHQVLKDLVPQKEFFVGIDSDGCAFDTRDFTRRDFNQIGRELMALSPAQIHA